MLNIFSSIFIIFFTAAISENIVLIRFLGICSFLGISKKITSAYQMALSVTFVMLFSTIITWIFDKYILRPFNLEYLRIIFFILVIASLVQVLEIYLKNVFKEIYTSFGIYLPLITTNCIILGVAFLNVTSNHTLLETIFYPLGVGLGYFIAMAIMSGIREKLELANVPKYFQGVPIALIIAGILAMSFTALSSVLFS